MVHIIFRFVLMVLIWVHSTKESNESLIIANKVIVLEASFD